MRLIDLALAVAQLLNWLAGKLDDVQRERLREAVWTAAYLKRADNAIDKAKAAKAAAVVGDGASADGVRRDDGFRRD